MRQGYSNTFQEDVLGPNENLTFSIAILTHNALNVILNDHSVSLDVFRWKLILPTSS